MEIDKTNQGKKILQTLFGILIVFQLGIIFSYLINVGNEKLPIQIVRFIITLTLVLLTYRGNKTSKWILVGYLIFNSVQGFGRLSGLDNYLMICLIALYTAVAITILFNGNISEFLAEQRLKNAR